MTGLPPELRRRVEEVVEASGLEGRAAERARRDLTEHLLDGLEAGRTPGELAERFGDPASVAPLLGSAPPPVPPRATEPARESFVAAWLHELRHVLRSLARAPVFGLTAVAVLALGIAATVVVATVVNEVVLRPLPVEDQPSLVDIWAEVPGGNSFVGFAWGDFADLRERNRALEELAAFTGRRLTLGEREGEGEEVIGTLVSANYLGLLGVEAALGRLELPPAPPFGGESVAVLSHGFWRSSFGSDPGIVGRTIRLDGHPARVVGVAEPGFSGTFIGFPVDLWLPLSAADPLLAGFRPDDRSRKPFELVGRLRPGATPAEAERSLDALAAELEVEHPEANAGLRVGVGRLTGVDHSLRGAVAAFVAVLVALAGMVLAIACLNVGSLLLVRTMSREREVAVRMALGAGRARLTRQLLTEAGVLVAAGAAVALFLARELNGRLRDFAASISGGLGFDLALDHRVVALTVGAAALAALLAGLAPALHLLRRDPAGALRARTADVRGGRLRALLVVGQVAVSVVLVVGTGLFTRSVLVGASEDPGFLVDRVASFSLALSGEGMSGSGDGGEAEVVVQGLVDEVASLPGVEAVTRADAPPLGVARAPVRIHLAGHAPPPGQDSLIVDGRRVGAGYLAALGIPLLQGRGIAPEDARGPVPVAVVSRAFAETYWPGEDPVGRTVGVGGEEVRVVGVAEDARYLVQDRTPDPLLYLSRAGRPPARGQVVLRARDPASLAGPVSALVRARIPGHPPVRLRTARQTLREALFPQRVGVAVIGSMGLVALLLAALGLYGLIQFSVTRDRRQLGVRLALGGGPASVVRTVLKKGFLLAGVGLLIGVVAARLLAPALGSFLVGVGPGDPLTYGAVVGCFAVVALLASWLPARRAMRIEPVEALRGE